MYAAFINMGCPLSQVVLAFEENEEFVQVDTSSDGPTAFCSRLPEKAGSGITHWVGISARKRAWGFYGSNKDGLLELRVAEGIRDVGCSFLASTSGALQGLEQSLFAIQGFGGIDQSRIFAFDGLHVAISVTEDHQTTFSGEVSEGLYSLGASGPRSGWQHDIIAAIAAENGDTGPWPSLVHMALNRISVHQRYRGDELESFAVQYMSGKDNGRDCAKSTHGQHVSGFQDAFLIFGKDPSDRTHFVQHARALMSQNVRRVDAEPRATFKGITPRRRKKDPKRPKGYVSGFNFFVIDQTKALVRESKGETNEINKKIGKAWRALSKEEREFYEERGNKDKRRYVQEMDEYKPSSGYEHSSSRINPPAAKEGYPPFAAKLELGTQNTKKPWTTYAHFAHQETLGVRSSKSTPAQRKMSADFHCRWKARTGDGEFVMPGEERALYEELEAAEKAKHAKELAQYHKAREERSQPGDGYRKL